MNTPLDLIVATYVNALEAERARKDLHPYRKYITDLAIVTKDEAGDIFIDDRDDLEGNEGARLGAVVGGVFGLALGPGGLIGTAIATTLGAVGGAVAGKIGAELVDTGINDLTLKNLVASLEPTSSAMVLIVEEEHAEEVLEIMGAPEAKIQRFDVTLTFAKKDLKKKGKKKS